MQEVTFGELKAKPPVSGPFPWPLRRVEGSFYDGRPGRELVLCPDCWCLADGLFGDHGGQCRARIGDRVLPGRGVTTTGMGVA